MADQQQQRPAFNGWIDVVTVMLMLVIGVGFLMLAVETTTPAWDLETQQRRDEAIAVAWRVMGWGVIAVMISRIWGHLEILTRQGRP